MGAVSILSWERSGKTVTAGECLGPVGRLSLGLGGPHTGFKLCLCQSLAGNKSFPLSKLRHPYPESSRGILAATDSISMMPL